MKDFYIKSIDSDKGLPVDQVHRIAHDSLGRLWLATSAGLVSYDGTRTDVFDRQNGLDCIGLRTVNISFEGEVWIGTDQGFELVSLDGKKIEHAIDFEWNYGIAECLLHSESLTFIGTSNGLLSLSRKEKTFSLNHHFKIGYIKDLILAMDRVFALSSRLGLIELFETTFKIISLDLLPNESLRCMDSTVDGYLLIGTDTSLLLIDLESEQQRRPLKPTEAFSIDRIKVHGPDWWLATGRELMRISAGLSDVSITERIMIDSTVNDLFIDDMDNVWVGTNNSGLKKISSIRSMVKRIDFGAETPVFAIKKGLENDIAICSEGMFTKSKYEQDTKWLSNPLKIPEAGVIWDCHRLENDKDLYWLAGQNGLFHLKDQNVTPYKTAEGFTNYPNRCFETLDGSLFLGTISGLYQLEIDNQIEIMRPNDEPFGYVYTLLRSSRNILYIGTLGQGLYIMENGEISTVHRGPLTRNANIYAIAENSSGDIAVIQDSELIVITDVGEEVIYTENPMVGWSLFWLNDEEIAVGSNNGLNIVNLREKRLNYRVNMLFGAKNWQFTCSRSLIKLNNGLLLCGLNSGAFTVDLNQLKKYRVLPELVVSKMTWENGDPRFDGEKYVIKDGKWTLNVEFFVPWFVDEDQLHYEYKMIGFDRNWSDPDSNGRVRYNSLPPGRYRLIARAYSPLTGYGDEKEIMIIRVTTPWWFPVIFPIYDRVKHRLDRWFRSASRNRQLIEKYQELQVEIGQKKRAEASLLEKQHELEMLLDNYKRTEQKLNTSNRELRKLSSGLQSMIEEERSRISREVHDVLGQKLTLMKLQTSSIIKKAGNTDDTILEYTNNMIGVIDETIGSVRKISTELRPSILDDLGLANAIEWRLNMFEKVTGIKTSLEMHDSEKELPPDVVTAFYRVFEESLTNIIRHAEASSVNVSYVRNENILELTVSDDGLGFDEDKLAETKSLGVLGMKERITILGGSFEIRNTLPTGTTLKAILPIHNEENINSG